MTAPVRIVVQDRRRLLREGLAELLGAERDFEVVAAVAHRSELPAGVGEIDAVLLSESDDAMAWPGIRAVRAAGRESISALMGSLRSAEPATDGDPAERVAAGAAAPRLTARETEVMRSMAEGLSTEQIGTTLGLAAKSVDNHKQRIYAKLGAQNGAHAVALDAGFGDATGSRTTAVVADPSGPVRAVLARTFDTVDDIGVVASVGSLAELLACCRRCAPTVVLVATSFGDGDLIDVLPEVLLGGARILVIGDAEAADAVSPLLFAGASGCLFVQDAGPREVVAATREVVAGYASLHPAAAAAVLRQWRAARTHPDRTDSAPPAVAVPQPTPREAQVLDALARGLPTKSIGRELAVSPKTVDAHIARLLAKLGVRNRAQAVSVALECGLLERREPSEPAHAGGAP